MSKTYTWTDLLTYVGQSYPRLQQDAAGGLLCDLVNNEVWAAYDWRESLATMDPFYLVALQQDYLDHESLLMPTDFLGLRSALLVYNGTEPATVYPPLKIMRYLDKTYVQGRTQQISYEAAVGGFRIFPRCPSGIGVMDYQIECTYKTNPVKVQAGSLGESMPFDDQYFGVYVEGMKYYLKPAASQQPQDKANFLMAIQSMAAHEAINRGEQPISPEEPLVGW